MNLSWMDRKVDPCNDFYRYACGGWIRQNPVPADQERVAVFTQMNDRDFYLLYLQLKQAAEAPETSVQKQYGSFYAACMDVKRANFLGFAPVNGTLAAIAHLSSKAQLASFLGNTDLLGAGFFSVTVTQDERDARKQNLTLRQDGLTLPAPDYYLRTNPEQMAIQLGFRQYLEAIFRQLGDERKLAADEAQNVLEVERTLAKASMSRLEMRDPAKIYHPMRLVELERMTPGFDWPAYFRGVRAPPFRMVNVEQPAYLEEVARVIATKPLAVLKSYLRFHAVSPVAPYLSEPFERASFQFFNKLLHGQTEEQPRWKLCTQVTNRNLSDAVGQDWVRRNFSSQAKTDAEELITHMRLALREEIEQQAWLSPEAKGEALKKADAIREKIGYPSHWKDYSGLRLTTASFVADLHSAQVFNLHDDLDRAGKPVDGSRFYWTAPEADGNYDPSLNDIEFPAGILQPPRYSRFADNAVNYGGLGTFVGHELTHGFDDEGSLYDAKGNRRDWFSPEDRAGFNHMSSCLVAEYNNFEALPGVRLDGRLSLGENTADNGGMRIAYRAFQEAKSPHPADGRPTFDDGFTQDQRFFLGFAQSWCETRTEPYQRMRGRTDPHPPGEFRVNGTVQNMPQFGDAFACRTGQPMKPEKSCQIW